MGLAGQGRAERGAGGGACEPTGEDEELGATSGGGEVMLCIHGRDGCATLHLQPRHGGGGALDAENILCV